MKLRFVPMGLILALGTPWGASPASAHSQGRTIVVDDDGADCKNPDAQTIQGGVDLAMPGDKVLVCQGTYAGGVVVNTEQLTLRAKGAVTVDMNLTSSTIGFLIQARKVEVRGFEIVGVNTFGALGIATIAPCTRMIDNVIRDFTGFAASAIGVFFTTDAEVENNTIFNNTFSIFANGTSGSDFDKNTVRANGIGIFLADSSNNDIDQNVSKGNQGSGQGEGILLCGNSTGNRIRNNKAHENGRDGIRLGLCEPGGPLPSGNQVRNNRMRDNGVLDPAGVDAHDASTGDETAGTANTWKNNDCLTDIPDGLCKR
ncbi:right-handed parallel beta-helix repeat-containing protein [Myxococcus sp. Y35]|uniref:right-handed parallel beta-helix repeat-containing protein n=1 Tax=Pseudomyxococcus flavus TaxID=3115648 RepID=UPI003CE86831